jgi:hypothetical protein
MSKGCNIVRSSLFAAVAILFAATSACCETADGFVTEIVSPSDFYLGGLHVLANAKSQCFTEAVDSNIELLAKGHELFAFQWVFGLRQHVFPKSVMSAACAKLPLTVGSHAQVIGNGNRAGGSFLATKITDYVVTIQQHVGAEKSPISWDGGALIEEQPKVSRSGASWSGTIWVDGYPMGLLLDTQLLTAPHGAELSYRPFRSFGEPQWGAVMPQAPSPPFAGSLFRPNTWAAYMGTSASELQPSSRADNSFDGRWVGENVASATAGPTKRDAPQTSDNPVLLHIRLWPNQVSEAEKEYVAHLSPLIHPPDWLRHVPGSIGFPGQSAKTNLQILPDESVQEFVSGVGASLIPPYQKALTEQDPTKIHFRFYVVQGEHPSSDEEMSEGDGVLALSQKALDRGIVAFPDGLIVIPDYVLARTGNEAQLAMVFSSAITSVIQKLGFITKGSNPFGDDWCSFCGNEFTVQLFDLLLNERVLRVGIRQMYLAGYDIREAPFAWALAADKPATNPVIDSKQPDKEIPWYTAYAFNYISQFYSDVDYSKLKRGEAEYAQFLDELRKADPDAFEPPNRKGNSR